MSNLRQIVVVSTKNGRITKFNENFETRTITIVSAGNADIIIENQDPVTTWGALKDLLSRQDYDLSNLKPTESINKTTLEHIDATLPTGDFKLFLRPSKTKSGVDYSSMNFRELRNVVNTLGEDAKKHLSSLVAGKNYTQLTTEQLREGLISFTSNSSNSAPQVTEISKEEVAQVTGEDTVSLTTNKEKAEQAKSLLNCIIDNTEHEEIIEKVESAIKKVDKVISKIEDYKNIQTETTTEITEDEALLREARELEEGF
jgi:hypothetical protein